MIIDAHTHIFPDSQAAAAVEQTARLFRIRTYGNGTAADLLRQMDRSCIDYAVIHMVAPVPSAVRTINSWLIQLSEPRFIKFATLHPQDPHIDEEIKRIVDSGISGVKFQPDIQRFYPDDQKLMYPVYEKLAEHNIKIMFHVGGEPLPGPDDKSTPSMIGNLAADFPDLTIIGAHLGGLNMWDEVYRYLVGRNNVYFESSLSYEFIRPDRAQRIILEHGYEKVFFGTDYPFGDIQKSLEAAKSVAFLNREQQSAILGDNARRFYMG